MNKQELKGAFSRIHASDDLMKEVLSVEHENKTTWNVRRTLWRVAAVAAAVAILVTALVFWPESTGTEEPGIIAVPGVMKVYAAEVELTNESEVIYQAPIGGGINSENPVWMPFTSVAGFGIPLTFSIPESIWGDVEITFDVSAEYGYFLDQKINTHKLGSSISLEDREKVYWRGNSIHDIADAVGENGVFYIDVIIRADGRIVGYGVVFLAYQNYACIAYSAVTMVYPLVDGEYQNITEDFVLGQIENHKQ